MLALRVARPWQWPAARDPLLGGVEPAAALYLLGQSAPLLDAEPQDPRSIPGGAASSEAGVGTDHGRVNSPVALIDELNDLFPPVVFDVEIDIWVPIPSVGEKSLEEQVEADGIHSRDAEAITDRRVGG